MAIETEHLEVVFRGSIPEEQLSQPNRPFEPNPEWVYPILLIFLIPVISIPKNLGITSMHEGIYLLLLMLVISLIPAVCVYAKRLRIKKTSLLPFNRKKDRFAVLGHPEDWNLPMAIPDTPFESRVYSASIAWFLKAPPLWLFLFPGCIAIIFEAIVEGEIWVFSGVAIGLLGVTGWRGGAVTYEVVPGKLIVRKSIHLGSREKKLRTLDVVDSKILADLIRGYVFIIKDGRVRYYPLLGVRPRQEFIYYLMLASRSSRP